MKQRRTHRRRMRVPMHFLQMVGVRSQEGILEDPSESETQVSQRWMKNRQRLSAQCQMRQGVRGIKRREERRTSASPS